MSPPLLLLALACASDPAPPAPAAEGGGAAAEADEERTLADPPPRAVPEGEAPAPDPFAEGDARMRALEARLAAQEVRCEVRPAGLSATAGGLDEAAAEGIRQQLGPLPGVHRCATSETLPVVIVATLEARAGDVRAAEVQTTPPSDTLATCVRAAVGDWRLQPAVTATLRVQWHCAEPAAQGD